jgi:maleate isomerase
MPFAHSAEDEAERWLRALRLHGQVGAALQALGVQRMALVHPPWFDRELNDLGAAYFCSQGFEVVSSESAELPREPGRIEPGAVVEWISSHVSDDAEAVFIGGTGIRAARAIEPLEERLERPVIESNQVLLWSILARLAADVEVGGYGGLLARR